MKNILEAIYETRSKIWDRHIEGNQKSTPEDRTTTGRSDHREKKKKNMEFDRKSRRANKIDLTPFPPDQFTWWLNVENRKYKQRRELLRITEIEFDKKTTISHPVVFVFDIEGRNGGERSLEWKEDLRSEARNTPGLCSTSSGHYRIDGQCRY